jgi:hypothetical protein
MNRHLDKQLSYVSETGNSCQIFRKTCGSYVISSQMSSCQASSLQASSASRRGIATLASDYAACQTISRWIKPAGGDAGYVDPLTEDAPT